MNKVKWMMDMPNKSVALSYSIPAMLSYVNMVRIYAIKFFFIERFEFGKNTDD